MDAGGLHPLSTPGRPGVWGTLQAPSHVGPELVKRVENVAAGRVWNVL